MPHLSTTVHLRTASLQAAVSATSLHTGHAPASTTKRARADITDVARYDALASLPSDLRSSVATDARIMITEKELCACRALPPP